MILNQHGISILAMGEHSTRAIKMPDGHDKYIHALGSANYLKIDKTNMIYYSC
jgi:hypothetical protein